MEKLNSNNTEIHWQSHRIPDWFADPKIRSVFSLGALFVPKLKDEYAGICMPKVFLRDPAAENLR